MNLTEEKNEIIKLLGAENDLSVIRAIKDILDHPEFLQPGSDAALDEELDRSIAEAERGEEFPAWEVLAELRKKYAA